MIAIGLVLLIVGVVLHLGLLITIGVILALVGLCFWLLGAAGHAVGGRRHWY